MTLYKRFLFPLLANVDPEIAHDLTIRLLQGTQQTLAGRYLLRAIAGATPPNPVQVFGLSFPNQLGAAAGYDKNGQAALGLALLGFGHVEVGTVTPWAQAGNPRPRVFRLVDERALINRMGFPNDGMARVTARLRKLRKLREAAGCHFVLGVSLGKQMETRLQDAAKDYVTVLRAVFPYADYVVVNVSSPNSPGLRQLQGQAYLQALLDEVQKENARLGRTVGQRPLLLKCAPDLSWEEIDQVLDAAIAAGVAGIVATNTTVARDGLRAGWAKERGGLSGAPLGKRSLEVIRYVCERTGARLPVIAAGGIMNAVDARARLDAGASLVQLYTSLVYEGPRLPGQVVRALRRSSA